MTNKKSFFEKLTGSMKFHQDDERDLDMYDEEYLDEDTEERNLSIQSDDYEDNINDEEEIGELSIDMYRINNSLVIRTMIAGVKKSDININVTRDRVVIEGTRQAENLGKVKEIYFEELYWGPFERIIDLPEEIDIELSEAHEEHGLLTIVLPLVDKHKQARLKIK